MRTRKYPKHLAAPDPSVAIARAVRRGRGENTDPSGRHRLLGEWTRKGGRLVFVPADAPQQTPRPIEVIEAELEEVRAALAHLDGARTRDVVSGYVREQVAS